jgi:TolB protein
MSRLSLPAALALALLVALLTACADEVTRPLPPRATPSAALGSHGGGPPHGVVFVSARDGDREIWVMNADGSDPVQLTFNMTNDVVPAWSPDGRTITFTATRDGNPEIYVMAADGSGQTNLTNDPAWDQAGVFSPDGKRIAFYSNRDGDFDIWVMNADGSGVTQLTNAPGADQYPDWSPNGKEIAFQRNGDIYVLDLRTGVETLVWDDPVFADMPVYSPNGKQLAFMSRSPGYATIFVIDVDGGTPVNLTPRPADMTSGWASAFPEWSRNGREIYFIAIRPGTWGDYDIYAINADGSDPRPVAPHPAFDSAPETR